MNPQTTQLRPCRPSLHRRLLGNVALALLMSTPLAAQKVPSFAEVTGHAFGERITQHHEMVDYLRSLAETSPRVTVIDQGASWEGRRLLLAVVTSEANHARLDSIRQVGRQLADPRLEGLKAVPQEQPAVVWLGGSIHGFELSGSEGLLRLLERLATAEDDATRQVLERTVVLIDPMINPDGRDAFAQFNHRQLGGAPNPRREDWNNNFSSWQALQFRTGHYYFDTNRDWFAHTQRETRARVASLVDWRPQVIIDAHEMGADTEFYFDPPTEPYGTYFPAFAKTWFDHFGAAYAEAFDDQGFEYTQREMFNYYYPGYTTSFGSYMGAVGMLYEQGSSRGLAIERGDGSVRRLADALEQQYTAAWTAVRLTAERRQELLNDYWQAKKTALEDTSGSRRFLLQADGDPTLAQELVELLQRNGIEVQRLEKQTTLADLRDGFGRPVKERTFGAGTWVIDAAQPASPLIHTLLEAELEVPAEFLTVARQRLDRGENPRFYDITAWSLPLLFNVEVLSSQAQGSLPTSAADSATARSVQMDFPKLPKAEYAYVIDGRSVASMAVLHQLRRKGIRAAVLTQDTRVEGFDVPRGSVVVRVHQRGDGLDPDLIHRRVQELTQRFAVQARAVDSGRGDQGHPSLGQSEAIAPKAAEVALLAHGGVHAYSFGFSWYTLEEHYGIHTTVIEAEGIGDMPLHRFTTLIIPDLLSGEQLATTLGEAGIQRLQGWVRDGGNLVVLGSAVDLARQQLGLISLRSWYETAMPEGGKAAGSEGQAPAQRFFVPGAILATQLDLDHWLSVGYPSGQLPFLVFSDRLYLAPDGPPKAGQRVALRVPKGQEIVSSGHLWPESLERLPSAVMAYTEQVGRGRVTAFAEDLSFRGYWRGTDRLFLNAVLLGSNAF